MTRRKRANVATLPTMLLQLGAASAEVIARRTIMMALGTCSEAEYKRMVREKQGAARRTALLLATKGAWASPHAALAPWHGRALANVKRLRRR